MNKRMIVQYNASSALGAQIEDPIVMYSYVYGERFVKGPIP